MDRGTRFYTKKSFLGGNFCLQNNQNRKKNRKFQKRRKENGKEKKREDIIRRGGEWIGSSVRVARLAGAPVCRYSRFSPLAAYCICAQCILHSARVAQLATCPHWHEDQITLFRPILHSRQQESHSQVGIST